MHGTQGGAQIQSLGASPSFIPLTPFTHTHITSAPPPTHRVSTLSQVLLSIQSAILVEAPWANEPGDEAHLQSERGIRAVAHHNLHLRLATLRFGILEPMKRPPRFFEAAAAIHFRHKKAEILAQVAAWTEEALLMAAYEEELEGHFQDIRKTLGEFQKVLQWSKVSAAHQQWSQGLERHEVFGECVCVCVPHV
jgi:hypothetical protein